MLCILFAEKQSEPSAKESESGQAEEDGDADPGPPGVDDESDSTKEEKKEEQNEESDSSEDEAEHKREIEKRKGLGAYLAMMRSESEFFFAKPFQSNPHSWFPSLVVFELRPRFSILFSFYIGLLLCLHRTSLLYVAGNSPLFQIHCRLDQMNGN